MRPNVQRDIDFAGAPLNTMISIIVPAHNESTVIARTLKQWSVDLVPRN